MDTLKLTLSKTKSLRDKISWTISYSLKPLYLFLRKDKPSWKISKQDLADMPTGTLGNDIFKFLHKYELYIIPKAEFHDVYHILFNMRTTDMVDEASIQFVVLGNGRYSLPYLSSTFISFLMYPEYWENFYAAFMKGRKAIKFHDLDFEQLIHFKTRDLQTIIFK